MVQYMYMYVQIIVILTGFRLAGLVAVVVAGLPVGDAIAGGLEARGVVIPVVTMLLSGK